MSVWLNHCNQTSGYNLSVATIILCILTLVKISMEPANDTLNIRPVPKALGGNNDALAAARARIAAIADAQAGYSLPQAASVEQNMVAPAPTPSPLATAEPKVTAQAEKQPLPAKATSKALPSKAKPIMSAIGTFLFLLLLFKSQVIISQIRYLLAKDDAPISAPAVTANAVDPNPIITIPKINVSAPVVYEPSINEAQIQRSLQNGVVHYGSTPKPGQPGNAVIVGHSSNDLWQPGNYKFVFVLLDKLSPGDTFSVNYESKKYVYEVTETKVVKPTDLSVLAPTNEPSITLITCFPPGTSYERLIVRAKQTSPAPIATNASIEASSVGQTLPGSAPGLAEQLARFWANLLAFITGLFS